MPRRSTYVRARRASLPPSPGVLVFALTMLAIAFAEVACAYVYVVWGRS